MSGPHTFAFACWDGATRHLLTEAHYERLEAMGSVPDRTRYVDLKAEAPPGLLAEVTILFSGWGCPRIGSAVLARMPRLELVAHAAGTVKGLVTESLWGRAVRVTSAAQANALPVAEFTVGAILLANKQVLRLRDHYRRHRRFESWVDVAPGLGNHAKVVGVVGASRIGRRVIELLHPFDLDLLVADPFLDAADAVAMGARKVELAELLAHSDLVTLHAPDLPETRHMIDAAGLALLRDGCVLVNTARGALVDHDALTAELVSGRIDAVIDVTDPEVLPEDSPLYDLPNVLLTPHIAGAQGTETQRLATIAIDEIERYIADGTLLHEVTREDLDRIA